MAVSMQWALAAVLQAGSIAPLSLDGAWCVPGFCPLPAQGAMPGGLMYLAVGLVWLGVAGLRHRRRRGDGPPPGV
jgi:hypothetical protein